MNHSPQAFAEAEFLYEKHYDCHRSGYLVCVRLVGGYTRSNCADHGQESLAKDLDKDIGGIKLEEAIVSLMLYELLDNGFTTPFFCGLRGDRVLRQ